MLRKIKQKKIEFTIIIIIIFIVILSIFGSINIFQSRKIINAQANSNLTFLTYSIKKSVDIYFQDAETEAEDCAKLIKLTIDDKKLKKISPTTSKYNKNKIPYISDYLKTKVFPILTYSIPSIEGLESIYFMFDPKFLPREDLVGIWYVKSKNGFKLVDNGLASTMFPETRSDLEWFYLPKKFKKGIWSKPYVDDDLKIKMVTYSTPVYAGKTFIGVTGLDLSIDDLDKFLSEFQIYKTGKAYLINSNNKIIFAKGYKPSDSTKTIDVNLYNFLNKSETNGEIKLSDKKTNIIKSKKGDLFSIIPVYNNFILVIYVPSNELYGDVNRLVIFASYTLLLAILISVLIAIRASAKIKKINNELMHKEKLISMGKMAAEVAHEINNPIGYLNCNIDTLKKFLLKLKEFMLYCKEGFDNACEGKVSFEEQIKNISSFKDEAKIDYIIGALEETIDESKEGILKVSSLVNNLKNFAKDDSNDNKNKEDLKQIIEESLNVLNSKFTEDVKIQTTYEDMPPLPCNKNQIEQVLINMIENAYHSVVEKNEKDKIIKISIYKKDKNAYIEIEDNGIGIDENNTNKIFEAFYTTKKQDAGTGLGLSIAYEIITNKHNGEISVKTKKGKGCKFTIKIPY